MRDIPIKHINRINRIASAMHADAAQHITITISRRSAWRECWLGITGWLCADIVADKGVQA